jgi:hypothetical protein
MQSSTLLLFKKIYSHFINPIESIKFDIRKILFIYAKIKINYYYKIKITKNNLLFEPDYLDLNNLINLISKIKPKTVIEFGGGYSTLIIAFALNKIHKNKNYEFVTLDQDKKFLKITKGLINQKFKKKIIFIHRKLSVKKFKKKLVSYFSNIPVKNYDFVYEDRYDHKKTKIAGDIMFLIRKNKRYFSFCVDGMTDTVNFLKIHLRSKYKISNGFFHGVNFIFRESL